MHDVVSDDGQKIDNASYHCPQPLREIGGQRGEHEAVAEAFLARYRALIADAYPAQADGSVLLPFPRLFMVATR